MASHRERRFGTLHFEHQLQLQLRSACHGPSTLRFPAHLLYSTFGVFRVRRRVFTFYNHGLFELIPIATGRQAGWIGPRHPVCDGPSWFQDGCGVPPKEPGDIILEHTDVSRHA